VSHSSACVVKEGVFKLPQIGNMAVAQNLPCHPEPCRVPRHEARHEYSRWYSQREAERYVTLSEAEGSRFS